MMHPNIYNSIKKINSLFGLETSIFNNLINLIRLCKSFNLTGMIVARIVFYFL